MNQFNHNFCIAKSSSYVSLIKEANTSKIFVFKTNSPNNPQVFSETMLLCIYQQPRPFEKFVFDSVVRKKSLIESEFILCYHTLLPKVWIVADLYSQLDPPLLSPHALRRNSNRSEKFVADVMHQVDSNASHYKYVLDGCHVKRTSNARQCRVIESKLRELKIWQQLGQPLKMSDREWIDNTIAMDYSNRQCEQKVYVGFIPYAYSKATKCNVKLAATTFTHAIYDSSEFNTAKPCVASISGGSKHVLKVHDCLEINSPQQVRLRLSDEEESWQTIVVGHIEREGIYFTVPAYTGNWNYNDGNRLIDIKILDTFEGWPKCPIKFLYV